LASARQHRKDRPAIEEPQVEGAPLFAFWPKEKSEFTKGSFGCSELGFLRFLFIYFIL
jgi:hypothetical protein